MKPRYQPVSEDTVFRLMSLQRQMTSPIQAFEMETSLKKMDGIIRHLKECLKKAKAIRSELKEK